jgi:hypothetical protein
MQTPVVCEIDKIDQWPRTLAGMLSLPWHIAACANTLKEALANSGVWPDVTFNVQPVSTADDVAWFASHPDRSHRLRATAADEFILSVPGASAAHCVIIQQIAPGTRLIVAIPDGCTTPTVSPADFMDNSEGHYANRDLFLAQLFDALCRNPGKPINVTALISNTHALVRAGASIQ